MHFVDCFLKFCQPSLMADTPPALHFVRCPKCLMVLHQHPSIAIYKCDECRAILRAKKHSRRGETLGSASVVTSEKNILDIDSMSNKKTNIEKQTSFASDYSRVLEQDMKTCASESSGESVRGVAMGKESQTEGGIPTKIKNSLKGEAMIYSNQEIAESNDSLESSPDSLEHDKINDSFMLRNKFNLNNDSISSTVEEGKKPVPRGYVELSKATTGNRIASIICYKDGSQERASDRSLVSNDFYSVQNWIGSEFGSPSRSVPKDSKQSERFKFPDDVNKVNIKRKVDKLRNSLLKFFDRTTDVKEDSRAHIEAKVSSNHCLSSLTPLLEKHNSCSHPHHEDIWRPRMPNNLHNAGFYMPTNRRPLLQEPQNVHSNDKSPQVVKRQCRPVSGGAPFVICYKCHSLLQVPADFLVLPKKVHKLRCGSCDEVLRYVFNPRTRVEAQSWANSPNNIALNDEFEAPSSKGLAILYSGEYDFSIDKSNENNAEPLQRIKMHDPIKEEQSVKKVSSKLHKLMGYSSARFLLSNTLSIGEGHTVKGKTNSV